MATERNVVDFKIHNLSEEKFQELKEAGQIDPNALYMTPDTTKDRLDALEENKQDIVTAVNYDNITNCITEIPQDIKLELNNGKLTLKAGSKVYAPNGTNTFDSIDIADDLIMSNVAGTKQIVVYVTAGGTSLNWQEVGTLSSGTTDSLAGADWHLWYDTSNNIIKRYGDSGSLTSSGHCFPIAIVTVSSGTITSIDQVFNGFGYIGGIVFTLPGVKGLIPDGRNADGTLRNRLLNCTTVQVSSIFNDTAQHCLFLRTDGRCQWYSRNDFYYNEETNTVHHSQNNTKLDAIDAGAFDVTSGVISNFNPKTAFRAVDYSEYISSKKSLDNEVSELNSSILSTKTELSNSISSTKTELNSSISSVDSSAVHKTGNETIADKKTFSDVITRKHSGIDETTTPSTSVYGIALQGTDKNNKPIGYFRNVSFADGKIGIDMQVTRNVNGTQKYGSIGVFLTKDGTTETSAPTPASTSNGGQIATTAWVRTYTSNVVRLVAEQKATADNDYKWYRKYSDGWLEQGGIITKDVIVTLPVPFSDDKYTVVCGGEYSFNGDNSVLDIKATTIQFQHNINKPHRYYACGYAAS